MLQHINRPMTPYPTHGATSRDPPYILTHDSHHLLPKIPDGLHHVAQSSRICNRPISCDLDGAVNPVLASSQIRGDHTLDYSAIHTHMKTTRIYHPFVPEQISSHMDLAC